MFCLFKGLCTVCVCDTHEAQKTALDPLGLELLVAVSHTWVLGTEHTSSSKSNE